jgi:acetyl-CoA/propionyl-CoA carboxylase carboxyl transferase subunit
MSTTAHLGLVASPGDGAARHGGATVAAATPTALAGIADTGTFVPLPGRQDSDDGVVAGTATVAGVHVVAYGTNPARRGGALTSAGCALVVEAIGVAERRNRPVLGVWHSGGADLAEGVASLRGVAGIFAAMTRASGRVAQLALVDGPAAGGAAYGSALNDIVVMTSRGRLFVTGPAVVAQVTGSRTDMETLGGPEVHAYRSGAAHVLARDRGEARGIAGELLGLLSPAAPSVPAVSPGVADGPDPGRWIPASPRRAYDIRPVVTDILDGPGIELHEHWAPNVHVRLGRLGGRPVGVVANNPLRKCGCLDASASTKAARFVRLCDAFGIPLVVLVDVPGYLPGLDEESNGVLRCGAKLLHAFAAAGVPRVTVLVRKAFGGAFVAMNSRGLGASSVLAWPGADVGIMNPESAVEILHRRELEALPVDESAERREELLRRYRDRTPTPADLVVTGDVDRVIAPADTRRELLAELAGRIPVRAVLTNIPL